MRKGFTLLLMFCLLMAGSMALAGQYRITPPKNMRKRPPPSGYRESRLEIVNRDDRGYAISVDYRRNLLTLERRDRGDMYVPGNSSVTLLFDDDDNWRIYGDNESLEIEIRSGRTTTLRLETRANRNQVGLFGTVSSGRNQYSKQLFRYADRYGDRYNNRPGRHPGQSQPGRYPQQPVVIGPPSHNRPPPPPPIHSPLREPSKGDAIGKIVGGIIDSIVDNKDDHRRPPPPGTGRR